MAFPLWMDIPAANVTAQYPTNGAGGITTVAASALHAGASPPRNFRFLGVGVLAVSEVANTATLTDAAGSTYTVVLPSDSSVLAFYALPELEGLSPASTVVLGTGDQAIIKEQGGIPCGGTFTLAQSDATTSSIRGYFVVD